MYPFFQYAIGDKLLQLIYLSNSPPFASQVDLTLEEVINDVVGYHPIRLQTEIRCGLRQCNICNHRCRISTGEYGRCHAIGNAGNTLVSVNYGLAIAAAMSTVEAHGLLHYRPASKVLMIGGLFCNARCDFCLNAPYTHIRVMHRQFLPYLARYHLTPSDVVNRTKKEDARGIIFSGNEPSVCLGFVLDTAQLARQAGLFVALQSNGFMTPETIELLASNIDAIAISLKGFGDVEIYDKRLREHGVEPKHILDSIKAFHDHGVHVEVTALLLKSDNFEASARQTSKWLASNVSREIPIDIGRVAPHYSSLWRESDWLTSKEVARIASICRDNGLVNVYDRCEPHDLATYCPKCNKIVVQRNAGGATLRNVHGNMAIAGQPEYDVHYVGLNVVEGKGYCANCGSAIYGIWK